MKKYYQFFLAIAIMLQFIPFNVFASLQREEKTMVEVNFASFSKVLVAVEKNMTWHHIGEFDEKAVFEADTLETIRVRWNDMEYYFKNVKLNPNTVNVFDVNIVPINVVGINGEAQVVISNIHTHMYWYNSDLGPKASFNVFDYGEFNIHLRRPNQNEVTIRGVKPNETVDLSDYFDKITPPQGPTIVVNTKFEGAISTSFADIEYTATPSEGELITEIFYSLNGVGEEYLYISEESRFQAKGEIDQGRIFIGFGDNDILFTVRDTSGKEGHFELKLKSNMSWNPAPVPAWEEYRVASKEGHYYVSNRITIFSNFYNKVSEKEFRNFISENFSDWKIIGSTGSMYTIKLPNEHTEAELEKLAEYLNTTYPDMIRSAHHLTTLDTINDGPVKPFIDPDIPDIPPTNDPWWNVMNGNRPRQWGVGYTRADAVWNHYGDKIRQVKIGVMDNGIRYTHEDLLIPQENIYNHSFNGVTLSTQDHGTHVIGTIGAIHNNGLGLAGVVNANRYYLYGYDSFDNLDITTGNIYSSKNAQADGLKWLVLNGAKVINASIGTNGRATPDPDHALNLMMEELLSYGYDFVVIHSAGNVAQDAKYNGSFAHVTDPKLHSRVITVGANDRFREMANFSNFGNRVDVVAPGVDIYSAITTNNIDPYGFKDGTSMAAPHVAGVAALVWGANPGLSGDQVKDIIVKTTNEFGLTVSDNRSGVPIDKYRQVDALSAVRVALGEEPTHYTGQIVGKIVKFGDDILLPGIGGAEITLNSFLGNVNQVEYSDENGHYKFLDVAPGLYMVTIEAKGYVKAKSAIVVSSGVIAEISTLEAVADNGLLSEIAGSIHYGVAPFSLEAHTEEGKIPVDLRFFIGFSGETPHLGEPFFVTTAESSYKVELSAGNYTVEASAKGYKTTTMQINIEGGKEYIHDISLMRESTENGNGIRIEFSWEGTDRPYYPEESVWFYIYFTGGQTAYYFSDDFGHKFYVTEYEWAEKMDVTANAVHGQSPVAFNVKYLPDGFYSYMIWGYLYHLQPVKVSIYDSFETLITEVIPRRVGGYEDGLDQRDYLWNVFDLEVVNGQYTIIPNNYIRQGPRRLLSINEEINKAA